LIDFITKTGPRIEEADAPLATDPCVVGFFAMDWHVVPKLEWNRDKGGQGWYHRAHPGML
jgi:hypothetical protein